MATHNIRITKGYSDSQTLELSDRGRRTLVDGGDRVNWHIHPQSGIASIRIQKKPDSPEIFSSPPQQQGQGPVWTGDIMPVPIPCSEWEYSIFWKMNGSNTEYEYDPKISVRPSTGFNIITKLILPLLTAFLSYTILKSWRRKKSKK